MRAFDLVLPAYNEAATLDTLVTRVRDAACQSNMTPRRFRLIIVDNGSTDGTAQKLQDLKAGPLGPWFETISIAHNQGYGHGVLTGLRASRAQAVGWSHADAQCDPRDAFAAYDRLQQAPGPTLVKGTRRGRPWRDRAFSRVFEACAHGLLNTGMQEINAQPKVFDRRLVNSLDAAPVNFAFDLYVLYTAKKQGLRINNIPVTFGPRTHGVSKWAATLPGRAKTIAGMVKYMRQLRQEQGRL